MRRSSSERLALVFLLSLSLTACGDDGTALPEVDLGPGTDFGTVVLFVFATSFRYAAQKEPSGGVWTQ